MADYAYDFTGADGSEWGAGWNYVAGQSTAATIENNQGRIIDANIFCVRNDQTLVDATSSVLVMWDNTGPADREWALLGRFVQDGGNYYYRVRYWERTGRVNLFTNSSIGFTTLTNTDYIPTEPFYLELTLTGTNPTTYECRWWGQSEARPATPQQTGQDTTGPQAAGQWGIFGGQGTAPAVYFDDFVIDDPSDVPPAPSDAGRRNLCPNPALANDSTGWLGTSFTRVTVSGFPRPFAAMADNWSGPYTNYLGSPNAPAAPGQEWSGSAWVMVNRAQTIEYWLLTYNGVDYTFDGQYRTADLAANTPTQLQVNGPLAAGGTFDSVSFNFDGPNAQSGDVFHMSAVRLEQIADPSITYADGDTAGWRWDGVAGSSTSRAIPVERYGDFMTFVD